MKTLHQLMCNKQEIVETVEQIAFSVSDDFQDLELSVVSETVCSDAAAVS